MSGWTCEPLLSIDDIIKINERLGRGIWFREDTLRWWKTRVHEAVYPTGGGSYFVTSDAPGSVRGYTIRFASRVDGSISSPLGFQSHETRESAHAEARRLAGRGQYVQA